MIDGTGRIGIPELPVGVPFPALPLQIMAARVADAALRDLVLTGPDCSSRRSDDAGTDRREEPGRDADGSCAGRQPSGSPPSPPDAFALTKEAFYHADPRSHGSARRPQHPASYTRGCSSTPTTPSAHTSRGRWARSNYSQTKSRIDNPSSRRSRLPCIRRPIGDDRSKSRAPCASCPTPPEYR